MPRNLNIYLDEHLWFPSGTDDFVMRWPVAATETEENLGLEWRQSLNDAVFKPNPSDSHTPVPVTIEDEAFAIFKTAKEEKDPKRLNARVLLTPANKQRQIVGSIRLSGTDTTESHSRHPPLEPKYDFRISVERDKKAKGKDNRRPRNQSKYVFSPDAVSDVVLKELGLIKKTDGKVELGFTHLFNVSDESPQVDRSQESEIEENPSGLIIVAGGTGTGKSTYARGIILRYLLRLAIKRLETTKKELQKFDPPHLVTYEDPIETWSVDYHGAKVKKNSLNLLEESESDLEAGIRITCRAKKYDVEALSSACIHALRQKPKIVYIGECRESKDWNLALELGGTGHLVVTTCHSASLVDTFVKVAGSESRDAQSRQKLASSLLGVLHLKTGKFKQSQAEPGVKEPCIPESFKQNQTYFSLWKNKPESVSNFVVDGLASLIIDDDNILSRRRMAELTLAIQAKDEGEILTDDLNQPKEKEEFFKMLSEVAKEMAFKIDLERN
jgi:hypothetical protein